MLAHERLLELLSYDPDSGHFRHIKKRRGVKHGSIAGALMPAGYVYIAVDGRKYYGHRLAYFYMKKEWPDEVDHINGDRSDNRWCNLRNASRQQNATNTGAYSNNSSGYRGVSKTCVGTWRAEIQRHGKYHHLGCFKTKEEAAAARNSFAKQIDGEFYNHNAIEVKGKTA